MVIPFGYLPPMPEETTRSPAETDLLASTYSSWEMILLEGGDDALRPTAVDEGGNPGIEDQAYHRAVGVGLLDVSDKARSGDHGPVLLQAQIPSAVDDKCVEPLIGVTADDLGGYQFPRPAPLAEPQSLAQTQVLLGRFSKAHVLHRQLYILRKQVPGLFLVPRKSDDAGKHPLARPPGCCPQTVSQPLLLGGGHAQKHNGCQHHQTDTEAFTRAPEHVRPTRRCWCQNSVEDLLVALEFVQNAGVAAYDGRKRILVIEIGGQTRRLDEALAQPAQLAAAT